jgi:hypothetical protein
VGAQTPYSYFSSAETEYTLSTQDSGHTRTYEHTRTNHWRLHLFFT